MECYETCADRGKKCVLARERISCGDCGKFKPCYNIHSVPCLSCPSTDPCNPTQEKENEKLHPPGNAQTCTCKQSCWEWILDFLGIGGNLPECCRSMQMSAWQSGQVAREALVSKFNHLIGRESAPKPPPEVVEPPKPIVRPETTKEVDKKITVSEPAPLESSYSPEETDSPAPFEKEPQVQPAPEKKGKAHKSRSISAHHSRSKHRKGGTRSRSISRENKKNLGKTRSSSSNSSTSFSQSRKNRKKSQSRSRSRSLVKVYNPFKDKPPFRCPSPCTAPPSCRPIVCPPLPLRSLLSRLSEGQVADFPQKYASPSCQNMQTSGARPAQLRRSNSMSLRPYQLTSRGAGGTNAESSFQCPPICTFPTGPRPPCVSQSFQPAQYSSPPPKAISPRSSCPPPKAPRTSSCLCFTEFSKNPKMCHRTCGVPTCCRYTCAPPRPACCCGCPIKRCPCACRACCFQPCFLSVPRMSCVNLAHGQTNPRSQLQSPPLISSKPFNICSSGAGCCCPSQPAPSMSPTGCTRRTSPLSMSPAHNNAICEQLISKYGYSPPTFRQCPIPCYGNVNEALCSSLSCAPAYSRHPGMGGCKAGLPGSGLNNPARACELIGNLTNSRKPRSPEGRACKTQIIEFNRSPCERTSKREFQLPPHCIRKTGPRSPVGEYLALMRVPKTVRQISAQEEVILDKMLEENIKMQEVIGPEPAASVMPSEGDAKTEDASKEPGVNPKSSKTSESGRSVKKKNSKQTRKKGKRDSEDRNASRNKCGDESKRESEDRNASRNKCGDESKRASEDRNASANTFHNDNKRESEDRNASRNKCGDESKRESEDRNASANSFHNDNKRESEDRNASRNKCGDESKRESEDRNASANKCGDDNKRESEDRNASANKCGDDNKRESGDQFTSGKTWYEEKKIEPDNLNTSAISWCDDQKMDSSVTRANANIRCADSNRVLNQHQTYIALQDSPFSPVVLVAEDGSPPVDEDSYNNNYGGESYQLSRYSSAGPVMIDFSELSSNLGRSSNAYARASSSANFQPRYSGANYHSTSTSFNPKSITSYTSQPYTRDSRPFVETGQFGKKHYADNTFSNININAQKPYTDARPSTTYNRSYNSHTPDVSDSLKPPRYNVQLETAIENKIKELRETRRDYISPPARTRIFQKSVLGTMSQIQTKPYIPDGTDPFSQEFIRESWETLNMRAQRRRKDLISTSNYHDGSKPLKARSTSASGSKQSGVNDLAFQAKDTGFMSQELGLARSYYQHNDGKSFRATNKYMEREDVKQRNGLFAMLTREGGSSLKDENAGSCCRKENMGYHYKDEKSNSYFKEDKVCSLYKDEKSNSYLKDDKVCSLYKDDTNYSGYGEEISSGIFKEEKNNCISYENNNDIFNKEDKSNICGKEQSVNAVCRGDNSADVGKEKKPPLRPTPPIQESAKKAEAKPASKMDCVPPVLQSLFEGTVQMFVRSRKADDSVDAAQPQEAATQSKVEPKDNAPPALVEPNEENKSSNKPDKSQATQRTLSVVSSPPHKPAISTSPEGDNSDGSDSSCSSQSHSGATSTVSLKMCNSAASGSSVSESASCNSSLTFTKRNRPSRAEQRQTEIINFHAFNSTDMSIHFPENADYLADPWAGVCTTEFPNYKTPNESASVETPTTKVSCEANPNEGSSVDPSNIVASGNAGNTTHAPCIDVRGHRKLEGAPNAQAATNPNLNSTPEGGDTSHNAEAKDLDTPLGPVSHGPVKSLDELEREQIRQNGTPV